MNRTQFQQLTRVRLQEARLLLRASRYAGSYYLSGYAVECALKACIAKLTRRYDFPEKELVNKAYSHDLVQLLRTAGLDHTLDSDAQNNPQLKINWNIIKDWKVESRYDVTIAAADARDLYRACVARTNGLIGWIRQKW